MTTKELSDYFNVSTRTIQNKAKELGIEMKKGQSKYWTKEDVSKLANIMNLERSKYEVSKSNEYITKADLKDFAKDLITETLKNIIPLIQNNQQAKQIEYTQDYYSIQGYAKIKGVKISFSDAIRLGKESKTLSDMKCKEVRKIPDERFGFVGSYHIDILKEVFEI